MDVFPTTTTTTTAVTLGSVFVVLCVIAWKCYLRVHLHLPQPGHNPHIQLPHTHNIELYFADISPASFKLRMCLAQANLNYKPNVVKLPSVGAWDTKTKEFLQINPAGTVPVLVHDGHPVYESNEQLKYIASVLAPHASLYGDDRGMNEHWVAQTNWCDAEMETDIEKALRSRPGNCLPILVLPCFVALSQRLKWSSVLYGFVIGGVHPKQIMLTLFALFGVHVFRFVPMLSNLVKTARSAMLMHLRELEDLLAGKGGQFIGGDDVVLADVAWAPLLDAMEFADWWVHVDSTLYPHVARYWNNVKELPSFNTARSVVALDENIIRDTTSEVRAWKSKYSWFRDMYESL